MIEEGLNSDDRDFLRTLGVIPVSRLANRLVRSGVIIFLIPRLFIEIIEFASSWYYLNFSLLDPALKIDRVPTLKVLWAEWHRSFIVEYDLVSYLPFASWRVFYSFGGVAMKVRRALLGPDQIAQGLGSLAATTSLAAIAAVVISIIGTLTMSRLFFTKRWSVVLRNDFENQFRSARYGMLRALALILILSVWAGWMNLILVNLANPHKVREIGLYLQEIAIAIAACSVGLGVILGILAHFSFISVYKHRAKELRREHREV